MKHGVRWMAVGLVIAAAISAEAGGPQGPRQTPGQSSVAYKKPVPNQQVNQQTVQQCNQQTVQQSNQQTVQQSNQQNSRRPVQVSRRAAPQRNPHRAAPAPRPEATPSNPPQNTREHDDNGHGNDPGRYDPSNPGNSTGANGNGAVHAGRTVQNHSASANNRSSNRNH